jgi:calcineurin-like phosphoesterase
MPANATLKWGKRVPEEPTQEMLKAGAECLTPGWVDWDSKQRMVYMQQARAIWYAMLEKAPK